MDLNKWQPDVAGVNVITPSYETMTPAMLPFSADHSLLQVVGFLFGYQPINLFFVLLKAGEQHTKSVHTINLINLSHYFLD